MIDYDKLIERLARVPTELSMQQNIPGSNMVITYATVWTQHPVAKQAADAIRELRADKDQFAQSCGDYTDTIAALRAENAALAKAIEKLEDKP